MRIEVNQSNNSALLDWSNIRKIHLAHFTNHHTVSTDHITTWPHCAVYTNVRRVSHM